MIANSQTNASKLLEKALIFLATEPVNRRIGEPVNSPIHHKARKNRLILLLSVIALTAFSSNIAAENWPRWRGPENNGISSSQGIPASWNKTENVKWRVALPGPAPSTPVIWGDRIFLTSGKGSDLLLLSLDKSGKTLWEKRLGGGNKDIRQGESNAASPSPSTDGEHVWVFTGTGVLACFDYDGREIWKYDVQDRYNNFSMYWGMSTSPLLDGDRLYLQLLHSNAQLVLALNKKTGKEIWTHQRDTDARVESLHSYASPVIYRHDGQEFLLTHGSDYIVAHNLKDGREIWRCGGFQSPSGYNDYFRFVSTPVVGPGIIIAPSAKNGPTVAINPKDAKGDITNSKANYHWKWDNNTTDVPSPLIHDGLVYICRENGVLFCIDAKTGEEVYKESVYRRRHRGSPVYADGKIFLVAIDGTINVIKAGREYELLATNEIDERMTASLAIADGTIYLRSYEALYAIE